MLGAEDGYQATHKDEGRVQVLVILFRVVSVKFCGFLAIHSEEVGPRVTSPERIGEFFEDGMEAGWVSATVWLSR